MPNVSVAWRGGWRFDGKDSGGIPVPIDGEQEHGAKPSDLLPLALAGCSATDLVQQLGADAIDQLDVSARYVQEPAAPWSFQRIRLHYVVHGADLTDEQVATAIERSEQELCSVAASLRGKVPIESSFDLNPDDR